MCCSTPSPPQAGQAPNGLLKENSRGSISGMVKPDTGQANFSEKIMPLGVLVAPACWPCAPVDGRGCRRTRRPPAVGELERAARANPPGGCAMSGRTTTRSTTTSMSCLNFLSSAGTSRDLVERAVDLDALEALLHAARRAPCGTRPCGRAPPAPADRAACLPAAPARGRPSARRSGSRSAGRWPANRARRRAPTAAACSRRSR